ELRAISGPPATAGIPAWPCRVAIVIPADNITEHLGLIDLLIEEGVEKPNRLSKLLIDERQQPCPKRRNRACPADSQRLPVHEHLIARLRVGVRSHVGHAPPNPATRVDGRGDMRVCLPDGQVEDITDAPATSRAIAIIPDGLAREYAVPRFQP